MKLISLRTKDIVKELDSYNFEISKKDSVQLLDEKIILINKIPSFFYYENKLVPTLKLLLKKDLLKDIYVDRGAIKFIIRGADVMRPGITNFNPNIQKDDFVVIKDSHYKKPLAIGISLYSSEGLKALTVGKAIRTIHHLGDEL